jgi:hypothetical protein
MNYIKEPFQKRTGSCSLKIGNEERKIAQRIQDPVQPFPKETSLVGLGGSLASLL